MQRWQNCVAVVTGASSGIGAAVTKNLLKSGLIVVGLARRTDRILQLCETSSAAEKPRLHAIRCDVSQESNVRSAFEWIENNLGGTHILINNAAMSKRGELAGPDTATMRETLDTNVMGTLYCVREAFQSMKKQNFDGHVVIVNSIFGHKVRNFMGKEGTFALGSSNMYGPSKFAVTAMVETYRQEFINAGTKIKVTSISPGIVDTEMIGTRIRAMNVPLLKAEDVSDAILYVLSTPPNVQVHELTIKPLGEPQ